ncbi:MAG: hypothetical protein IPJ71_18610 [Bdellovibrionales bacterium]|nr:hypothetical protein [Bdellovibrionales bacterium]
MGQFCRKRYNSEYYLRNKERIREYRLKRKTEIQPSIVESQLSLFEIQRGPQIVQPRVKLSNLNFLASWSRYSLLLESLTFYSVKRLNFISQTIQTLSNPFSQPFSLKDS